MAGNREVGVCTEDLAVVEIDGVSKWGGYYSVRGARPTFLSLGSQVDRGNRMELFGCVAGVFGGVKADSDHNVPARD